jgi:hypothetical protein
LSAWTNVKIEKAVLELVVFMANKKTSAQVRGFGNVKNNSQVKSKNHKTVTPINRWEAWECQGDETKVENWYQVHKGSLDDCFNSLEEYINCQLEEPMIEDGSMEELITKYDDESDVLLKILESLLAPKIANLKAQCLQNGRYEGQGWAILSAPSKFKQQIQNQYPFTYSDEWEAWERVGEDENDPDSWDFLTDGSLQDCLNDGLHLLISIELDYAIQDDQKRLGKKYDDFFEEIARRHRKKTQEITKACLQYGEYKGEGWTIRSQRTREQCEWLAKNGHPAAN